MTLAIEARGLGKQYVRGAAHRRGPVLLRDALAEWAGRAAGRKPAATSAVGTERFWALQDVSFAVEKGAISASIPGHGVILIRIENR